MPGLAPKKPPIKAYPLLKPDKKRQVDAAPAVERDVFAWLLLAASQDEGWKKRKHPCLVCEKSGWPCLDPEARGSRTRCEGCFCAGYHCQSIPSRPEPSTLAPLTLPNTRSSYSGQHGKKGTSSPRNRRTSSSDEPMDIDDWPPRRKEKMPKTLTRRRVVVSESDSDLESSVAVSFNGRRKTPTSSGPSKRYRISSPVVQPDSSDIEFLPAYQPEASPAYPMTPISPLEPMQRVTTVDHTPPAAPRKSAAENFLELLGSDSSSGDENSTDSSDAAPLPPRPLPVRPIPILSAPRTNRRLPVNTPQTANTDQPATTPHRGEVPRAPAATRRKPTPNQQARTSDSQGDRTKAALSWKHRQREPSTTPIEVDSQGHDHSASLDIEEDELDVEVKEEKIEESQPSAPPPELKIQKKSPVFKFKFKFKSTAQPAQQPSHPSPLLLNSSQQLTIPVVRRIIAAAQISADPSFCLSINSETASPGKDTTIIVVSEAEVPPVGMVPWHILLCERSSSTITVIYKLQEPESYHSDQQRLYSTASFSRTIPRAFRNGLAVPRHPDSVVWKACRGLEDVAGPVWATCLAIWLTRGGDLNHKLSCMRNLRIREELAIENLNQLLQGEQWSSACIDEHGGLSGEPPRLKQEPPQDDPAPSSSL